MPDTDNATAGPIEARVVHRSIVVDQPGPHRVAKLMLNLTPPAGRQFTPGSDIAFAPPGRERGHGLRHYTIEAVGEVPFEQSIDVTLYVREHAGAPEAAVSGRLLQLQLDDRVDVFGPFAYPFYPPMGSRSSMILIGAGSGMVPFRWLAHKVQSRRLDWMGKVLMLEGPETGLEHRYLNDRQRDQDQYFDLPTHRAFEALKTRYSGVALDRPGGREANIEAVWRLLGQGSVFVYRAGYRAVADAMDQAMAAHLRLAGRWHDAKTELQRSGHWLEFLYD